MSTLTPEITSKDKRYDEMFDAENEAEALGTTLIDDPYPRWADMLSKAPVMQGSLAECMGYGAELAGHMYHAGHSYYTALSFEAVSECFTNKDKFCSGFYGQHIGDLGDTILGMDGERHRRLRDVVQPYFQPTFAQTWWNEKTIRTSIEELISSIEENGHADLNADFFARLPMHAVTAGFGLSPEEGLSFRFNMQKASNPNTPPQERGEAIKTATGILYKVIEARRAIPQDDIISKLATGELKEADGTTRLLTVPEIMRFCQLIVFAGGGTTWRQLGITLFGLLTHPDQFEAVKNDRSLIPNTVLEAVRWETTDPLFPRMAVKDTTLMGVDIPKDSVIHVCIGAANRDPSRWENPEKFDIFRPMKRSLAFAAGAHSCLGQHVARQEIAGSLNAIIDRLPNIRWDDSKPPAKIMGGLIGRGPGPLHVVFG